MLGLEVEAHILAEFVLFLLSRSSEAILEGKPGDAEMGTYIHMGTPK